MLLSLQRQLSMVIFIAVLNHLATARVKRPRGHVRLNNLELLVAEAGSAVALARLAKTNESYLSQIRRQLTTPKGTPRGVGDSLAAKLEQAMGKPHGWMDVEHAQIRENDREYDAEPGPDIRGLHPLISWVQAGEWADIATYFELDDAEDLIPCPVHCSKGTFVLRVRGESMEPKFHDGDLIFVDPQVFPDNGRYVVVRIQGSHEATFKQLIVEGDRRYLKALNPDWPNRIIEVSSEATICGVVVFKGEVV